MKHQRTLRRTFLVWAMLPLMVSSTSPRSVCCCAIGGLKCCCNGAQGEHSCCSDAGDVEPLAGDGLPPKSDGCGGSRHFPIAFAPRPAVVCHCTLVAAPSEAILQPESSTASPDEGAVGSINPSASGASLRLTLIPADLLRTRPEFGRDMVILLARMLT